SWNPARSAARPGYGLVIKTGIFTMKKIILVALAISTIAAGAANARSFSGPRYMIGLNPDLAKKFYTYSCNSAKTLCGNWNVGN
ncbi:MAG: hypothetical protein ABJA10_01090, partial [Aestuariivirga sp.]